MRLMRTFLIIGFILSLTAMAHAIQVSFYSGDVKIIRNGKEVRVSTGVEILSGDIIKTGNNGMVEIVYNDNSKIIVREQSRVRIGSVSIKDSENPALILGRLTGKFEKIAQGTRRIYGATAVCAIRGTEFDVASGENGDTLVDVKEGVVQVENPAGQVALKAGEQAESNVPEKPEKEARRDLAEWLEGREQELAKEPSACAGKYNTYVKSLQIEGERNDDEISAAEKMISGAKNRDDLAAAEKAIDTAEDNSEDNIMLAETAAQALEMIVENFKKSRNRIYLEFEKTKKDADRAVEIQLQSHADIQALRDEFKKTHERIIGNYNDDSEKVIKDADIDKVKPEIKKY